ncbi:MAG TPA: T9SS type A sorting domain-containing protein [Ignavibacteria bacterium]|nr:T9SS type A sorting domain-containing protein [Ignavibacteria bacterium]
MLKSVNNLFVLPAALIIIFLATSFSFSQLVNDFKVNDDSTNTSQDHASLGVDGNGNFVVVWYDWRNSNEEIFCQLFNSLGQKTGSNFCLVSPGYSPDVAVRKDGSFGLCWVDSFPKFRLFNKNGVPISNVIKIDSVNFPQANTPSIACDSSGNFVVVFQRKITLTYLNIHFQLFDSLGNKVGSGGRVNDDTLSMIVHKSFDVTKRRDGSFIVTWQDYRMYSLNGTDDIYIQMYDRFGGKIGNNARVNNDTVMLDYQHLPKITSDDAGRFAVVFTEIPDATGIAYNLLQLYNPNGMPYGNNIRFSNNGTEQYPQICKKSNGDLAVSFERNPGSANVPYMQRMDASGGLIGTPFLVSNQYPNSLKGVGGISIFNDKIITVFVDNRFGNFDVFFNIRSFIKPDSVAAVRNISTLNPNKFKLHQNYPNPFNSVSKIKFEIAKLGDVNITVYDILGKEVSSLVNEKLKPGTYETFFDGSGLSSGIYFCRLIVNTESKDFKKMILLK